MTDVDGGYMVYTYLFYELAKQARPQFDNLVQTNS